MQNVNICFNALTCSFIGKRNGLCSKTPSFHSCCLPSSLCHKDSESCASALGSEIRQAEDLFSPIHPGTFNHQKKIIS